MSVMKRDWSLDVFEGRPLKFSQPMRCGIQEKERHLYESKTWGFSNGKCSISLR